MDHYLPAVHRALAFIEENLTNPIGLDSVARRAGFSLWHFQRVFAAYVGEPLGTYLRRRRLTVAAEELRAAQRSVLAIALDFQFESHAAFTRAFRATFGQTPSDFRRVRKLPRFRARAQPTAIDLHHLSRLITMQPQIVRSPVLHLVGLEARFIGPMSPGANNHEVIPPLFQSYFRRQRELPPALDRFTYGACDGLPESARRCEGELVYLVGASVAAGAPVPAGMKRWEVPAATYALFVHRGPIARIGETMNYIYGTWLGRSDHELAAGPSLERYDDRFGDGGAKSELDVMIPVKPRG